VSEAAIRERRDKQRWAVPGSTHDRIVRWSKIILPSAVGVLLAILAVAPLDKNGDVSFILDKNKAEQAP
jgi:lipopolysaccharide export system protein LptC